MSPWKVGPPDRLDLGINGTAPENCWTSIDLTPRLLISNSLCLDQFSRVQLRRLHSIAARASAFNSEFCKQQATMAARVQLAFCTLCILLCSLHGVVTATTSSRKKSLQLTYFAHELRGGANSTLLAAAGTGQGNMSAISWGTFLVVDNFMKAGNTSDSLLLGSITGTAVVTTVGGIATGGSQINTQHIFKQGSKYDGSSLTVIGTIQTPTPPYECIIPGGTGALRGYSGYGILTPLTDATVPPLYVYQWDVYITYKK